MFRDATRKLRRALVKACVALTGLTLSVLVTPAF
jgi:hypothetical protein